MAAVLSRPAAGRGSEQPAVRNVMTPRVTPDATSASAVSTSFTQYDVADRDHLVVEVVGRVVQPGAVAVADEDEGARPRFQHEGEILRAHHRRNVDRRPRSRRPPALATAAAKAVWRS